MVDVAVRACFLIRAPTYVRGAGLVKTEGGGVLIQIKTAKSLNLLDIMILLLIKAIVRLFSSILPFQIKAVFVEICCPPLRARLF